MADIVSKKDKNIKEPTGEKVLREKGIKGLVTSDLPKSEVISALSKRVNEEIIRFEKYKFVASQMFSVQIRFDGLMDIDYAEYKVGDATGPFDDPIISDFSATRNEVVRFTYEAKTQYNIKTKIMSDVLMNFKTNPSAGVSALFKSLKNLQKANELFFCYQVWTELMNRMYSIKLADNTPDVPIKDADGKWSDSVAKQVHLTLKRFKTSHKKHIGTGTDLTKMGVITNNGVSVQPTNYYDSSEFYVIENPEYASNVTYEGEKYFFNWNGQGLQVKQSFILDWDKAEEIPNDIRLKLKNARVILIHESAIAGILDWKGSGVAYAGKLETVINNYTKQDVYPLYDSPVILFEVNHTTSKSKSKSK